MSSWTRAPALTLLLTAGAAVAADAPPCATPGGRGPSASSAEETVTLWGLPFVRARDDGRSAGLEHRRGETRIEVFLSRGVSAEVAAAYVDDELEMFRSLFTLRRTGYPGQQTRFIECPGPFRPVFGEREVEGGSLRTWIAFANANRVAGACTEDLAVLRAAAGFLHCREAETLLEVRAFFPLEPRGAPGSFLDTMSCTLPVSLLRSLPEPTEP